MPGPAARASVRGKSECELKRREGPGEAREGEIIARASHKPAFGPRRAPRLESRVCRDSSKASRSPSRRHAAFVVGIAGTHANRAMGHSRILARSQTRVSGLARRVLARNSGTSEREGVGEKPEIVCA